MSFSVMSMGPSRRLKLISVWAGLVFLTGGGFFAPIFAETTLSQRLAVFPTTGLPLRAPVTIYWNEHQVPFIEAQHDEDLALTLGLVHAHLRLAQMSFMRLIALGRISEMAGIFTKDLDHSLRILNPGKVVPEILRRLPPDQRRWLERYVEGINHYQDVMKEVPREWGLMGIQKEPWKPEDILTMGRVGSADVNWIVFFRLMTQLKRDDWPQVWARLLKKGTASFPSYTGSDRFDLEEFHALLLGLSRSGSNTIAISGHKSATGGALIASDPHLGILLPNMWLIAGYKSPSYHTVGLMAPGIPFMILGRNRDIAWGASNLRAASSDLFDITDLPPDQIRLRTEKLKLRFWWDQEVEIRETDFGPVITDVPLLKPLLEQEGMPDKQVALYWMGHRPSNELGAMLKVNRARNWKDFREAFDGFSVPGQNMLFADTKGRIGQVMAVKLPRRPNRPPADLVLPRESFSAWDDILSSKDLPAVFEPAQGFLASSNNRAAEAEVPIGFFFSSNNRIERIYRQLSGGEKITVKRLAALQRDVYMASSVVLRDQLVGHVEAVKLRPRLKPAQRAVLEAMERWDGHYRSESAGALAFELVMNAIIEIHYEKGQLQPYLAVGRPYMMIGEDLNQLAPAPLTELLAEAFAEAVDPFEEFQVWGGMHRIALNHPLGRAPVIGSSYRFGDHPASGSSATVMKTAHRSSREKHFARYGSNARHISDLSDPDRNFFVVLGGQDGWIGSSTFLSQFPLWEKGEYIQVPLRLETVKNTFPHRLTLRP